MNSDNALIMALLVGIATLINFALIFGRTPYNGIDLQFGLYINGLVFVPILAAYITYKIVRGPN